MLAAFVFLVLFVFRTILLPTLALVIRNLLRLATSGGAKHCATFDTVLPLRAPLVHLYLRTTLLPFLANTCLSNSSRNNIVYPMFIIITTIVDNKPAVIVPAAPIITFVTVSYTHLRAHET